MRALLAQTSMEVGGAIAAHYLGRPATPPIVLGLVVYGWNKPSSLVRGRSRTRMVIAALLALLEIAGWITLGVFWWLKK